MDRKIRICFVVQRYGLEVNGGAELHCRQLAEHMKSDDREIHVATTKAVDYSTWKNTYKKNEEVINGITVHRFPVKHQRDQARFDLINSRFLFYKEAFDYEAEREWINLQGPECPKLVKYLKDNKDYYDVFIFFTYLYYTTVIGLPEVADKAILIPTAHDEPFLKMKHYAELFHKPRFFFYNTEEERQMVNKKFHNENIPSDLGGTGVEIPDDINPERFKAKYNLNDFIVYVGRIDQGKNCGEMFRYFRAYKKRHPSDLKLVLMGKPAMDIPKDDDILSLGFVSDEDKFDGIAAARMLLLPSIFESLSMVVLEAMCVHTNVVVNGKCPVLKGHCVKSNGALYYMNYPEFEGVVDFFLNETETAEQMKLNAYDYVQQNYQWDVITGRLGKFVDKMVEDKA